MRVLAPILAATLLWGCGGSGVTPNRVPMTRDISGTWFRSNDTTGVFELLLRPDGTYRYGHNGGLGTVTNGTYTYTAGVLTLSAGGITTPNQYRVRFYEPNVMEWEIDYIEGTSYMNWYDVPIE